MIYFYKKKKVKLIDFKLLIIISLILIICIILSKNNEDFGYYHLPNSIHFHENKLEFGLGVINHGFKHISSLFHLNSIFILPIVNFYLVNLTNFLLLIFTCLYLVNNIFFRKNFLIYSKDLSFIGLLLILTKFSRLAEYGTDIFGQFIILIIFIEYINYFFSLKKESVKEFLITIFSLVGLALMTKVYYIVYYILIIPIIFETYNKDIIKSSFLNKEVISIFLLPILFVFFLNFSSTGCLVYPLKISCFSNLVPWALDEKSLDVMILNYEQWAKAGKGAGYELENGEEYIKGVNWVGYWINNYFFTKVSDYLLLIFVILTFYLVISKKKFFNNKKKKISKKTNFKIYLIYLIILLLFTHWFFNFPALRYGGYVLIFLLIAYPFIFLENKFGLKFSKKKYLITILFCAVIFNAKNFNRINNEFNNKYLNYFSNFPFFYTKKVEFKEKEVNVKIVYMVEGSCWGTPSLCVRDNEFNFKKLGDYNLYFRK